MNAGATTTPTWVDKLPWHNSLYKWQPFKIDALGLVTLLGAEEINSSLGRLVPSRYLEYFPLLGAYVIANESFKQRKPSFNLYNFTDGINTIQVSFWLARWLSEQEFEQTRSVVHFEIADQPRSWVKWQLISAALSTMFVGFLVAMTVLIGDWYGFANAIAMICSIFCRAYSMRAHRNAIDRAVVEATRKNKDNKAFTSDKKCLIILDDSKAITVYLPGHLIVPVFTSEAEPLHSGTYHLVRYFGWAVFGVHIITIGMATLVPQMYTVGLIVIPTVLICWKLGCDDSKWKAKFDRRILRRPTRSDEYECWFGSYLRAYVSEWPVHAEFELVKGEWMRQPRDKVMAPSERSRRRQDLYAWLNLTNDEEASMGKWDLLPHVRNGNRSWWDAYQAKKALIRLNPLDTTRKRDYSTPTTTDPHQDDSASESSIQLATRPPDGKKGVTSTTAAASGDSSDSSFHAPSRTRTWLTSNGFVVTQQQPLSPTRTASALAGMALGLPHSGVDPGNLSDLRPALHQRVASGTSKS